MASQVVYAPILKGKLNEFKALGKIPRNFTQQILPMLELLPPKEDESIEIAVHRFASAYQKHCSRQPACIDLHAIKPEDGFDDGSPALEATFSMLLKMGLPFIPVHGFDREPELWQRISKFSFIRSNGLVYRLERDDIETPDDTVIEILQQIRNADISPELVSLVLDLKSVGSAGAREIARTTDAVAEFIEYANSAANFQLISVVASSMPNTVSGVPENGESLIDRVEMDIWLPNAQHFKRKVCFGDYSIVHPNFSEAVQSPNANAKIRYTRGRHHHVFRGHSLNIGKKYGQYFDLARRVLRNNCYLGPDFSFGDDRIWNCAHQNVGSGNLGTWVEVDTNHHIVYTVYQMQMVLPRVVDGVSLSEVNELVSSI